MWRLPLWPGYRKQLDSKVADLSNTGEPGQAGAITAALFLQEFARQAPAWVHIDTAGWVSGGSAGPGRPEGGDALALRALWRLLQDRYGAAPPQ
jgi:leucyl aminopeptidase